METKSLIKRAADKGIFLDSIRKLYSGIAKGDIVGDFTVPAFNLRTLTFDTACAIFRAAKKAKAGTFLIEIARSEMEYTNQTPREFADAVLLAAIEEKWQGPIFLQGDHFSLKSNEPPETLALETLIKEAIGAGFYNIDIDCSKLVDLNKQTITEQQNDNVKQTAKFISQIRRIQPKNISISIGGEVDKIGGGDTTIEELIVFLDGLKNELRPLGDLEGIIKVACQMGTTHGGKVLASGDIEPVQIDFAKLKELSRVAKKHGLAGIVQHGASTLPDDYFSKFAKAGVCEVHLSTEFQNIVLDSQAFPKELKDKIYNWLKEKFSAERKKYETDEQFLYKVRKKALGPFKKEITELPEKTINKICQELENKFVFFFKQLRVSNTQTLIKKMYG
ncbi:MAG: class II fructose-bisphosphate aldolase [Candidatus Pacebacteria bacterium]|nr:class II fructose-bisphosphate aldolase [Candidatus Paceibacterota bacterium]